MRVLILCVFVMAVSYGAIAQQAFNDCIENSTLRINWTLCGNGTSQMAFLEGFAKQNNWGGAQGQPIDPLDYGNFRVIMTDAKSGKEIYSRGFGTLFEEWQTTREAKAMSKAFHQVIEVPYPKSPCRITIRYRSKSQKWSTILTADVDPKSVDIVRGAKSTYTVKRLVGNGLPGQSVDLAFLPEGYTLAQMDKFYADVKRLVAFLLTQEPFNKYADRINVWAVGVPSQESGTDDPNKDIWKNTAFNTGFNTFGTDRYLETLDVRAIHDALVQVPFDHAVVVVNTNKYGGGGVYNHFTVVSADNRLSDIVFVHELGHGFGGLGDEYYDSEVAYTDPVDLSVEPWEPNLTTLVDFGKKWKPMVEAETPVPTPIDKSFINKVGAFEGGGYTTKGVYRPAYDCRMKSNEAAQFCKVCQQSIEKVIKSLIE